MGRNGRGDTLQCPSSCPEPFPSSCGGRRGTRGSSNPRRRRRPCALPPPPVLSPVARGSAQDNDSLTLATTPLPPSVPARRMQQEPRKKGQYQATLEDLEDEFATRGGLAGMIDERAFRRPVEEEETKPKRRRIAVTPDQVAVLQAVLAQVRRPPTRPWPHIDGVLLQTSFPTTAERDALSLQLEMPRRKVQVHPSPSRCSPSNPTLTGAWHTGLVPEPAPDAEAPAGRSTGERQCVLFLAGVDASSRGACPASHRWLSLRYITASAL